MSTCPASAVAEDFCDRTEPAAPERTNDCPAIEQSAPTQTQYGMNEAMIRLYREALDRDDLVRGNRIAWRIVMNNIGLIKTVARPLYRQFQCKDRGFEFEDLLSAGYEGLRHAIRRFDPDKGLFSTYAAWWINEYLKRHILNFGTTISMPDYLHYRQFNIRRAEDVLFNEGVENPSDQQLAKKLGWKEREVANVRRGAVQIISFDAAHGADGRTTGHNDYYHFCAQNSANPEHALMTSAENWLLRDMLAHVIALAQERLSAQESFVLFSRYGIDGHRQEIGTAGSPTSKRVPFRKAEFKHHEEGKSLAEIGQLFGITRERVRQIEAKALGKIRRLIRQRYPEIDRLCQQGITTADNGPARSVH